MEARAFVLRSTAHTHWPPYTQVVFNTSLAGYQEIMTDPSYKGQFVAFTCPHIGNVGINMGEQTQTRACLITLPLESVWGGIDCLRCSPLNCAQFRPGVPGPPWMIKYYAARHLAS